MRLSVWYHCKLSGSGIPDEDFAVGIMAEQMHALKESGLAAQAQEIHIGVNGDGGQGLLAAGLAPDNSILHVHGKDATTELPTFALMRGWLLGLGRPNEWAVLYHHSKGVTRMEMGQPGRDEYKTNHRRLMEAAVVWNWKTCVRDLECGYDAVGINWVDPITRPVLPGRFFAGNFWWARADFLIGLPAMPDNGKDFSLSERQQAEFWIGRSKERPKVLDYERPHLSRWCQSLLKK